MTLEEFNSGLLKYRHSKFKDVRHITHEMMQIANEEFLQLTLRKEYARGVTDGQKHMMDMQKLVPPQIK